MDALKVQSRTIDMLRLPLMSLIILIHMAQHYGPVASFPKDVASWRGVYDISYIFLTNVFANIAIPGFLLISGYLFFSNFKDWSWNGYAQKLKRRVHTLLIPYLLWNIIFILLKACNMFRTYGTCFGPKFVDWVEHRGLLRMFWNSEVFGSVKYDMLGFAAISTTPVFIPLWFIRDLIVLVVFAPVIYWTLKKMPIPTLLLLFAGLYTGIWIHLPGFNVSSTLYFCLGAFFAIAGHDMVEVFSRFRLLSLVLALVLICVSVYLRGQDNPCMKTIGILRTMSTIVAVFGVASWLVEHGITSPKLWGKGSFFVYVAHTLYIFLEWSPLSLAIKIMSQALPDSSIVCKLLQLWLVPLVTVAICLALYWIMQRFLPKITGVLTGNR